MSAEVKQLASDIPSTQNNEPLVFPVEDSDSSRLASILSTLQKVRLSIKATKSTGQ